MRRDVLEAASGFPNMVFPVFTNGTMIDKGFLKLLEENRNIIPVFSIEGGMEATDRRRGAGAYESVEKTMAYLQKKKMLFGASITVTKENMKSVTAEDFARGLRKKGCGVLFYVEYVPVEEGTRHLMLDSADISYMQETAGRLKDVFNDMIVVSFPGDEEAMGGCLASGRGFFHINSNGGAEPCPFSPYSRLNLKTGSIKEALSSGFFAESRNIAANAGHNGGCTLFDNEEKMEELMNE